MVKILDLKDKNQKNTLVRLPNAPDFALFIILTYVFHKKKCFSILGLYPLQHTLFLLLADSFQNYHGQTLSISIMFLFDY